MSSSKEVLERARAFLRGTVGEVDPCLPKFMQVLREAGAEECWHKHGSFFEHLSDVYRILKLWGLDDAVARCGLFHSAYSNSYVNLAIFEPDVGRPTVRELIGDDAEQLVHAFCIVPRQQLIHDQLLFRFSDQELIEFLHESAKDVSQIDGQDDRQANNGEENKNNNKGFLHRLHDRLENLVVGAEEEIDSLFLPKWRKKLQQVVPAEGVRVKHIRTGEDIQVPRRLIAIFLVITIADFADQRFSFQDLLFDNSNGELEYKGDKWKTLWPGDGKPGLWMSSLSRMGVLYNLIAREEKLYMMEHKGTRESEREGALLPFEIHHELVIPPVFDYCTAVLSPHDQIAARDAYWEAVCMPMSADDDGGNNFEEIEKLLRKASALNPFIGEPHVVLAQLCNSEERYEEAETEADTGLRLLLEWGTSWDKRMSWQAWVAWARVQLMKAKERSWPQSSRGILSLGLVK